MSIFRDDDNEFVQPVEPVVGGQLGEPISGDPAPEQVPAWGRPAAGRVYPRNPVRDPEQLAKMMPLGWASIGHTVPDVAPDAVLEHHGRYASELWDHFVKELIREDHRLSQVGVGNLVTSSSLSGRGAVVQRACAKCGSGDQALDQAGCCLLGCS